MSLLPFSDSGYYLDNKKDAEQLDSGYYLYVLKNVYLLSTKPTCLQLPEEITDQKKQKQKQKTTETQLLNIANEIENLTLFKAILQCLPARSFQK